MASYYITGIDWKCVDIQTLKTYKIPPVCILEYINRGDEFVNLSIPKLGIDSKYECALPDIHKLSSLDCFILIYLNKNEYYKIESYRYVSDNIMIFSSDGLLYVYFNGFMYTLSIRRDIGGSYYKCVSRTKTSVILDILSRLHGSELEFKFLNGGVYRNNKFYKLGEKCDIAYVRRKLLFQ